MQDEVGVKGEVIQEVVRPVAKGDKDGVAGAQEVIKRVDEDEVVLRLLMLYGPIRLRALLHNHFPALIRNSWPTTRIRIRASRTKKKSKQRCASYAPHPWSTTALHLAITGHVTSVR